MIPLMLSLACTATDTGSAGDSGGVGDSGVSTTDTEPATEITDTVSLYGTAPAHPVPLPDFAALNLDGAPRGPGDLVGHPTVIWFYPLADTPG